MPSSRKPSPAKSPPKPARDLRARAIAARAECVGRTTRNLARRVIQSFDEALSPSGVSFPQFALLLTIAAAKDDTLGALAIEADLDPSTLTRNLQGLEKAGLVEVAVVETDLRKRAVWLTETGARTLEATLPVWEAAQARLAEALGPQLVAGIARAASKV